MSAANEIGRFFKQVGVTLGVAVLVLSYPVYVKWGTETLITAAIGCAISTVNVLIGGASAMWAFDKPQPVFLKTVLGGMAMRMLGICVIFVALVRLTDYSILALGTSLFMFYLIFQALEIRFLTRRVSGTQSQGE